MIRVSGLTKSFSRRGPPAIESVSFDVSDGEIVGFVGLNGAGKTTTIRIAAGVSLPGQGSVLIDGHDVVSDKVEASRRVGWVPETPNFEPNATALSLMEYFSGYYGTLSSQSKSSELLASVGLQGEETKKLRAYSQGMKKRFALAACMLNSPKNYLFDEVLNGLDPEGIRYFRRLMVDLRSQGSAVLLSSHMLVEIEGIADRIVFIHRGKVIRAIARSDLVSQGHTYIRIVIRNPDARVRQYLEGVGTVREGSGAFIVETKADPAKLNSELLGMGYQVSEFSQQNEGLEEYFLNLVGGK
ncbi:MAG: ABC transporter ATP-binding protein [Nitrososphaerota archaeon]|nr:ABC transporter ATP-binding protein [Nitrososphaerota archaeon]